jgi:hypothetical protein
MGCFIFLFTLGRIMKRTPTFDEKKIQGITFPELKEI